MSRYKGSHKLGTVTLDAVTFEIRHARRPDGSKAPGFMDLTYEGQPVLYEVNWFEGKDVAEAAEFFSNRWKTCGVTNIREQLSRALEVVPQ